MPDFALNQMTVPTLGYEAFLDLAAHLGCIGVEARNDLGRPLFDGLDPETAGAMTRARGLRLLGVSQVYPFNDWSEVIEAEIHALLKAAKAANAETISLIPRNDGTGTAEGERQDNLSNSLRAIAPILQDAEMIALIEPLGFARASLRSKAEVVGIIETLGSARHFRIVHDTFHHTLAGERQFFPQQTGIVHLSGVSDPAPSFDTMEDEHRILVDEADRLGNIDQIAALITAGYQGAFSMECFAPATQNMASPFEEIGRSFEYIRAQIDGRV